MWTVPRILLAYLTANMESNTSIRHPSHKGLSRWSNVTTESVLTLLRLVLMTRPFIGWECLVELFMPVITAATRLLFCAERTLVSSVGLNVSTALTRSFLLDRSFSILSLWRSLLFLSPMIFASTRRPACDSLSLLISYESYQRFMSVISTPLISFVFTELTFLRALGFTASKNNLATTIFM